MCECTQVRHCAECLNVVSMNPFLITVSVQLKSVQDGALSYKVICWSTEHLLQSETERLQECDVRLVAE